MSINRINNLNQYAYMQTKKTQLQNKVTSKANDIAKNVQDGKEAVVWKKESLLLDENNMEESLHRRQAMRDALKDVNTTQAMGQAINPERLAQEKEKAAKFAPIQSKLQSGKPLTAKEKSFLRENYPDAYAMAMRIEEEIKNFRNQLSNCQTKGEANKLYVEKKLQCFGVSKEDCFALAMIPALDEAYRSFK